MRRRQQECEFIQHFVTSAVVIIVLEATTASVLTRLEFSWLEEEKEIESKRFKGSSDDADPDDPDPWTASIGWVVQAEISSEVVPLESTEAFLLNGGCSKRAFNANADFLMPALNASSSLSISTATAWKD